MRPIIVTTPRTGSTVICQLLFNIAAQRFKYKNNLDEYFTITTLYDREYQKVNGLIKLINSTRTNMVIGVNSQQEDEQLLMKLKLQNAGVIQERIELLRQDPRYMIKVFSTDLSAPVADFVTSTYDLVYLERKDKIKQLLSYFGLVQTNVGHYTDASNTVSRIVYNADYAKVFIRNNQIYNEFKQSNPSKFPTLYYEDFVEQGTNEQALIDLLGLDIKHIKPATIKTIPTPYSTSITDLIVNKDEWARDLPDILNNLGLDAIRN